MAALRFSRYCCCSGRRLAPLPTLATTSHRITRIIGSMSLTTIKGTFESADGLLSPPLWLPVSSLCRLTRPLDLQSPGPGLIFFGATPAYSPFGTALYITLPPSHNQRCDSGVYGDGLVYTAAPRGCKPITRPAGRALCCLGGEESASRGHLFVSHGPNRLG